MYSKRLYQFVLRRLQYSTNHANIARKRKHNYETETLRNTVSSVLKDKTFNSDSDWVKARSELLTLKPFIPENIDSNIVNYFMTEKKYPTALSYIQFLRNQGKPLNLAVMGKYFKLLTLQSDNRTLTEREEEELFHTYETLRQSHPVLDSFTLESVLSSFSLTSKWQLCYDLLREIKRTSTPSGLAYSCTIKSCFVNNEHELAWNLLDEMFENDRVPNSDLYLNYLKSIARTNQTKSMHDLEKLLTFFEAKNVKIDSSITSEIMTFADFNKIPYKLTRVNNKGICYNCKNKLVRHDLSESEFDNLKEKVFKQVIIGEDVFRKTTPDELGEFRELLARNKKYDVVIDGLNVAYSAGTKQSTRTLASFVISVVNHFKKENKNNILVIGRTHMCKWPTFSNVKQNADLFLTSSTSQDDPYLLYIALHSGRNTIVVSRDLMRSHRFLLKNFKLKLLFDRWLDQRLYQMKYADPTGKVVFKVPKPFTQSTQKVGDYWHVPFSTESMQIDIENKLKAANDIQWLCLKNKR